MNPTLILTLIQAIRLAISTAKELGLDFTKVWRRVSEVEATGREFTIADAHLFVQDARAELDLLDQHIKEAITNEALAARQTGK